MDNLVLFVNAFLSYGVLFLFIVALILVACFIGIGMRKRKNAAEEVAKAQETTAS